MQKIFVAAAFALTALFRRLRGRCGSRLSRAAGFADSEHDQGAVQPAHGIGE